MNESRRRTSAATKTSVDVESLATLLTLTEGKHSAPPWRDVIEECGDVLDVPQ